MNDIDCQEEAVKKIALLTPYTGANLGDAAIQEAIIVNIKKRLPSASIRGITLNPKNTTELHGICCFPLISTIMHSSGESANKKQDSKLEPTSRPEKAPLTNKYWLFFRKAILYLPRILYRKLAALGKEAIHIYNGYAFVKKADQAIYSGGGQLDDYWGGPWHHPYTILKWAILARIAGAELIFLSVGADHLKSPLTRFFIKRALILAQYRSYRDEETRARVAGMGVSGEGRVYPDLAFSLPLFEHSRNPAPEIDQRLIVGVSPIGATSWASNDREEFEKYLEKLTSLVVWLFSQNYRVLLFPSQTVIDPPVISEIRSRLDAGGIDYDKDQIICEPVHKVGDLLLQLSRTDMVVASRLHSVLLAILLSKPVLALSYRSKVSNLMDDAGFGQYCLDITDSSIEDLMTKASDLVASRSDVSAKIFLRTKAYRDSLEEQYNIVFGKVVTGSKDNSELTKA